ncbi:DUF3781 domain-containing protein [Flammeovirga pacifica]|uniref:DUF3781 domain-containing protein n=1 Tax=Flammeovirga pacifica TaxID=915059 RepID=A0A1S1YTQ6_FLAPC|nr:DUF3781 domain-containing protein [Flammeovirga pacifica]OHX64398.1 hypothetical protein NH26_22660 [Flammeovirga pacifica]
MNKQIDIEHIKANLLKNICYTELVYGRINKKLGLQLSNKVIEKMLYTVIDKTSIEHFVKRGKNIYIHNEEDNIRITINIYTLRVITVDVLSKSKPIY